VPNNTETKHYVQSVERALEILRIMQVNCKDMGITELSRELNLSKSTVHRLITTLEAYGFVRQIVSSGKYRLGWGLFEIGNEVSKRYDLTLVSKPFLQKLSSEVDETVILAILDRIDTIYLDKAETNQAMRMEIQIGRRLPAYCTALGKVLLAGLSEDKIKEIYRGVDFIKYTGNTISTLENLLVEIESVRSKQYAIDDEEYSLGFRCIAAPIHDAKGNIVAGISLAGPASRLTMERFIDLCPRIQDIALQFSAALGYNP
jgi:IclR family KDG regulon transcriptional repressor